MRTTTKIAKGIWTQDQSSALGVAILFAQLGTEPYEVSPVAQWHPLLLLLIYLLVVLVVLLPAMTIVARDPHAELLYLVQDDLRLPLSIECFTDDHLSLLLKNLPLQDNEISLVNSLRRFRNPTNPRAGISQGLS